MLSLEPVLAQIMTVYCAASSTSNSSEFLARCARPVFQPMPGLIGSTVGFQDVIIFKLSIRTRTYIFSMRVKVSVHIPDCPDMKKNWSDFI